MIPHIDLNADVGEGFDNDAEIIRIVTSCNIACGGHTGDADSMKAALKLAHDWGTAPGAHPSYPDRKNFGRIPHTISADDLKQSLVEQLMALRAHAEALGIRLSHVKPHGALYHCASTDEANASLIANVTAVCLPGSALVGPPNSMLTVAADKCNIKYIAEGFADRAYDASGKLRDRALVGSTLNKHQARIEQAIRIATKKEVVSYEGDIISIPADTICVHGDTPGALETTRGIAHQLRRNGIEIRAPQ